MPLSHLRIEDLSAHRVIFEEDVDEIFLPMCIRDLNDDGIDELVSNLGTATARQIIIYSVNPSGVLAVLNEYYRVDASLIKLSGETTGILITTGEGGVGPFYTTRYQWKGDRFQQSGRVP